MRYLVHSQDSTCSRWRLECHHFEEADRSSSTEAKQCTSVARAAVDKLQKIQTNPLKGLLIPQKYFLIYPMDLTHGAKFSDMKPSSA